MEEKSNLISVTGTLHLFIITVDLKIITIPLERPQSLGIGLNPDAEVSHDSFLTSTMITIIFPLYLSWILRQELSHNGASANARRWLAAGWLEHGSTSLKAWHWSTLFDFGSVLQWAGNTARGCLQGKEFNLSIKIDVEGLNPRDYGPFRSKKKKEVSDPMVWLLSSGLRLEVEECSTLTFEITKRPSFLSRTRPSIFACFSTVVADLCDQRKRDPSLETTELTRFSGSGRLDLSWEIEQLQCHSTRTVNDSHDENQVPKYLPKKLPSQVYSQLFRDVPDGIPLWTPMCPRREVSGSYKRNGIEIGDIGIITPQDGAFQCYFNIFLPPGHNENPPDLPDNLLWTGPVPKTNPFQNGSGEVFQSNLQENHTYNLINSPTMEYQMCACQWAILVIPNGSQSECVDDAEDQKRLHEYVSQRRAGLYEYFTEKLGIEVKAGDLYLVHGLTKANCWGMAAFSYPNPSPPSFTLKFQTNTENGRITEYIWNHHSDDFLTVKSGPELQDIQDLREGPENDADVQQEINQCLFVRAIDVLNPDNTGNKVWRKMGGIGVETEGDDGSPSVDHSRTMTGPSTGVGTTNVLGFSSRSGSTSGRQKNPLVLASPDAVGSLSHHFTTLSASPRIPNVKPPTLENMDRPEVPRSSSAPSSSRNSSHRSHRSLHGKSSTRSKERQSTVSSNKSSHTSSRPISPCPTVSSISSSLSTPPLSISSSFSDISMPASPRSISKPIPQILSPVEETCTYTTPERRVEDVDHPEDIDPEEKAKTTRVRHLAGSVTRETQSVILDFLGRIRWALNHLGSWKSW
ncbi:hypothetical protein M413DRAFT_27244 [Hebeloma cylindrosporum]|uniref:Uncharacterized protein n=1 Tax=Hebeloma cylindrosporum TaxID=76867 RepID=A0A0C2YNA1_HEBCY|nr:hypothetical protein M413DRAFT_27244 [Hebeloma cylindrosporum h7]